MKRWQVFLAVAGFFAAYFLLPRAQITVPRHVEFKHSITGYPTITIKVDGLEDLKPLPKGFRLNINLPEGFRIDAPTDFTSTVDGEVRVKDDR